MCRLAPPHTILVCLLALGFFWCKWSNNMYVWEPGTANLIFSVCKRLCCRNESSASSLKLLQPIVVFDLACQPTAGPATWRLAVCSRVTDGVCRVIGWMLYIDTFGTYPAMKKDWRLILNIWLWVKPLLVIFWLPVRYRTAIGEILGRQSNQCVQGQRQPVLVQEQ